MSRNHQAAEGAPARATMAPTERRHPGASEIGIKSEGDSIAAQSVIDTAQHHSSRVNGLGMWSAWERNFSNKLKACLDLVDNAVDAALWDSDDEADEEGDDEEEEKPEMTQHEKWKKQTGRIHISTEQHRLAMGHYDDDSDDEVKVESNINGSRGADIAPPLIIHDILGNGGVKRRESNGNISADVKNEKIDNNPRVVKKNDFVLIDDENTLCLHNDCVHPVKELKKILDVYNSDKTESAIGENGVGVKQATAAMSDLSIVVTTRINEEPLKLDYGDDDADINSIPRIRKCLVSIGILSKKMQSKESCTIPSWRLRIEFCMDEHNERKKQQRDGTIVEATDNENDNDEFSGETCRPVLLRELANVTANNALLGKTMKEFGGAAPHNRRKYGIQRLAKHIELMITSSKRKNGSVKPPHPHQFLMILHKFGKHQPKKGHKADSAIKKASVVKARNDLDDLLRDLADEMPKTYLHIPPSPYFKIKVNRETLKFQYWERHLVELHQIPLLIDRRNDFRTAEDWLTPRSADDCYQINVSIGFDPSRANSHGSGGRTPGDDSNSTFIGGQACSLLIFSRISGRLFLKHDDARGVLRLTNSGTNFCQGLTIIVDDYEGHLPLTPTKESLAFGLEDYGKIHERNLYAWLSALATVYWNHFFNMFKTKTALGNAVKSQLDHVKSLEKEDATNLPTLRDGSFSTVEKLYFSRERVKDSIRPYKSEHTTWRFGPHTLIRLRKETKPSKPKNTEKSQKRKAMSGLDGYDSDGNDLMKGMPPASIFEEAPTRSRRDGRPVRPTTKPQRFDELLQPSSPRKKKLKGREEKTTNADIRLKKRLKQLEAKLEETQAELNESKATCDDLQIQLEERGTTTVDENATIRRLESKLKKVQAKHKEELEKVEAKHVEKIKALMVRIGELKTNGKHPAIGC